MEDEYITVKTAMLAKQKGFNEPCRMFYHSDTIEGKTVSSEIKESTDYTKNDIPVPTQSLLARWLREKHNIHVGVGFCVSWRYIIIPITDKITADWSTSKKDYSTYEDAMEEGLKDTLKHI